MEAKKETWSRKKYSTLQGNTAVDYEHNRGGKIKVQALGILLENVSIETHEDLDSFAQALSSAWVDKTKLHNVLRESIMGPKK